MIEDKRTIAETVVEAWNEVVPIGTKIKYRVSPMAPWSNGTASSLAFVIKSSGNACVCVRERFEIVLLSNCRRIEEGGAE